MRSLGSFDLGSMFEGIWTSIVIERRPQSPLHDIPIQSSPAVEAPTRV